VAKRWRLFWRWMAPVLLRDERQVYDEAVGSGVSRAMDLPW